MSIANPYEHVLRDERSARIAFARLAEPADPAVAEVVATEGYAGALRGVLSGRHPKLSRKLAPRIGHLDQIDDDAIAAALQARIVVPGDPAWPRGLDDLEAAPHCLWVRGGAAEALDNLCTRSVAVVGARAATAYGLDRAADLGAELSERRFTVVSGAAIGIDAAAHQGALAVEAPTVAVLACGIDRIYPRSHEVLLQRIAETGAIVTELPPGAAPYRQRFLQRNRLIAAMTCGTIVVEAALRSGSLATAAAATQLARPVGALPGPVTSMCSAGCHQAIREGIASLVTDAADVADLLGSFGRDTAPLRRAPVLPEDELPGTQRSVWEVLPVSRPASVAALAERSALDELAVQAALGPLELAGLARRSGEHWMRASRVAP
ncbi:MAG: DNA-processing protein DprA [Actinobacteria bacterium]|nr:DNA-processing protein DprA [Actinomycetota bacterium]